jgi:hypothetical protein
MTMQRRNQWIVAVGVAVILLAFLARYLLSRDMLNLFQW